MQNLLIAFAVLALALVALEAFFPATATRLALGMERKLAGMSLAHASTADFEFSYFHGGKGETLLLVHGFGADMYNFSRIARHLKKRFRVIAVDLPGFGASTRLADASYRIPDQTRHLKAIADCLGLDRFHIGGSSMGGAIAIDYAATHPEQIQSLLLLAPGGVMSADDSEMIAAYRNHQRTLLIVEKARDFAALLALVMSKQPYFPGSIKRTLGARAARDAPLHKRIFEDMVNSPASEERARLVEAPALIVWGREDRVLDVSGGPILRDEMPRATLKVMEGIGHLPMLEVPRQTAQAYVDFVEAL